MNPVFYKEQLIHFRAPKLFSRMSLMVIFLSLLVLLIAFVFSFWPNGSWIFLGKYLLFVLLIFLATGPVRVLASVDTMVGEKEHNTYHTLIVSALTPMQLVWGKMFHLFFQMTCFQLQLMPLLLIAYLFGGHQISFIFLVCLLLFAHNGFLSSLHIYLASVPMSPAMNRYYRFYSPYSLQKNMASSLTTILCTLPVFFVAILWINMISSPKSMSFHHLAATHLNSLRICVALNPILTVFFWGEVSFFGLSCPMWLLSIVMNLVFIVQVLVATETYHRNIENDPSCRFRGGLLGLFLFIELLFLAAIFEYGTTQVVALPLLLAFLMLSYLVLRLGLTAPQECEKSWTFSQRIRLNFSPKTFFRSLKATAPGYCFGFISLSFLLYALLLYGKFHKVISLPFFLIYALLIGICFWGLWGFAIFLSSLKNGPFYSPSGSTILLGIAYIGAIVGAKVINEFSQNIQYVPWWLNLLKWIGKMLFVLNPFGLFYCALLQWEGYNGSPELIRILSPLIPENYFLAVFYFGAFYFLLGGLFLWRGQRNLLQLKKEETEHKEKS